MILFIKNKNDLARTIKHGLDYGYSEKPMSDLICSYFSIGNMLQVFFHKIIPKKTK
jgi:hypothetical protein